MIRPLFQNLSLKRKLTGVILLACCVGLLLACIAFVSCEQALDRRALASALAVLTDLFDDNVAPGIASKDSTSLTRTLNSFDGHPHILAAAVYDWKGRVAATYQRRDLKMPFLFPAAQETGTHFEKNRLEAFRTVTLEGERIGTLYIASDLDELRTRFASYAVILTLVFVLGSLLVLLLSAKLQKIISEPILQLAKTAAVVATEKNYSIRAIKHGEDELGSLVERFNEMLAQIEKQDNALREAGDNLEMRVVERTQELHLEIAERRKMEEALRDSEGLVKSILDSLAANIVVLDDGGNIALANKAWEKFARENHQRTVVRPGLAANFLDMLRQTAGEQAHQALEGIAMVLNGTMAEFSLEYPCHSPQEQRWFMLYATPLFQTQGGAVIAYINITERKRAEAELAVLHNQFLETSRAAGMAEVATGVLHNVGNVLNSVNVSATLIADNVRKSKIVSLSRVAALLDEQGGSLGAFITTDPRGKQLPRYISQLARHLAEEQQQVLAELEALRKNIDHIKEIVSMQQSHAKVSGVIEAVKLTDLVEDALRMNGGALAQDDVEVVREYEDLKPTPLDKHKVLQILVNLIRNAKYACDNSGRKDKRLTVRVSNGGVQARVAVIDNGVGIPPENLTRIFNHGFTTREDGHGFGLHSGALAAKEMGGALIAQSEGPGRGATFILELPQLSTRVPVES